MPLPWKTMKNARISQLVNDHLHRSRKRRDGSSLFVETGFPTSLVDLFIKNREKLKKTPKKNRQPAPTADFADPVIPEIPTTPSNSPAISPLITGSPSRTPSISSALVTTAGSVDGVVEGEVVYEAAVDATTVLMAVLKMFLVVVLALGTKRLTVGITISAFLLFFLEYAGKHARVVLKRFSEVRWFLKSMGQCALRLFRFKEDFMPNIEQERLWKSDQEVLIRGVGCEIQPVNEINQDQGGRCETEQDEVFVIGEEECNLSKRKSRRAKMKSKMKKLVPKKLRCPKKEQSSKKVEIVGEEEEKDNSSISLCDEQVVQYEDERESDNCSSVSSSTSSWRYKEEENNNKAPALVELTESVTSRVGKSEGIENWRYLVPCMIVLAGLIGGRGFAVLVTLAWFLMLKVGDKVQRGVLKVPVVMDVSD